MRFTLYHSDYLETPANCMYPHAVEVTDKDSLLKAGMLVAELLNMLEGNGK